VKNDYGTQQEARALNGLEESLKKRLTNNLVFTSNFNDFKPQLAVKTVVQSIKLSIINHI
jgi:hypothetical protein